MAMEAIEKVTQTEQQAAAMGEQAAAEARRLILQAEQEGKALLSDEAKKSAAAAKELLAAAEQQGAELAGRVREDARQESEALQAQARTRLDRAAALIAERVVNC